MTLDPRIGTELAGYRIEALLGRGGMSVVYRAEDRALRRKVALKVLAPELAEDERFRERFLRESHTAASIDHANVIPIYEAGESEGLLYIAMRYVEGTDLGTLLRREGLLEPGRALAILGQAAAALDAARFARGLVHRDVKPGNILIAAESGADSPDHVYLSDFGLSKRTAEEGALTEGGHFMGTIDYVAPEQIEGEPVDGRADVYSLGCVLYECLTGQAPYVKDSKMALLWAHLQAPPPAVTTLRPDLPAGIDEVVARALAKSPDDRYPTCRELIAAARAELKLRTEEHATVARPPSDPPRRRRFRLPLALAALLVVAAAATIPSVLLTGGGSGLAGAPGILLRVDPRTNRVTSVIGVGVEPGPVAVSDGAVWVANRGDATISQIDPQTNAVVRTVGVGGSLVDMAIDETETVWVSRADDTVLAIPPFGSGDIITTEGPEAVNGSDAVAVGQGSVWTLDEDAGVLLRIDSEANKLAVTIELGATPFDVTVGAGAVWVGTRSGAVLRIDPATNRVTKTIWVKKTRTPGQVIGVAAGGGAVWAVGCPEPEPLTATPVGYLVEIDPETSRVRRSIRVGKCPHRVAVGTSAVWLGDPIPTGITSAVFRVDPEDGRVVARIDIQGQLGSIAVGADAVWVSSGPA